MKIGVGFVDCHAMVFTFYDTFLSRIIVIRL